MPEGVKDLLLQFEHSLLSNIFNEDLLSKVKSLDKSDRVKQARQLQSNLAFLRQILKAALGNTETDVAKKWESIEQSLQEVSCTIPERGYPYISTNLNLTDRRHDRCGGVGE